MAENYVLLETINLTQSASSVTFDNLPSTGYTDLKIVASVRASRSETQSNVNISFNGSTTNFNTRILEGIGSGTPNSSTSTRFIGAVSASSSTASTFGNFELYIPNYTSSNFKSFSVDGVTENNASLALVNLIAGLWSDTAAITSITLSSGSSDNFLADSTFSLHGIAALNTTPVFGPFASGGNIVANDGTYWYHAFLSSGTFTPYKTLSTSILVIGAGGGGGAFHGGGGGGGAIEGSAFFQTQSLISGNYPVAIGAGGAGAVVGGAGSRGGNSLFYGTSTITALGGGGGGSAYVVPTSGGSGGGTGQSGQSAAAGSGSNTFAGGTSGGNGQGGGGGGGATAAGTNASNNTAGAGGQGKTLTVIDSNLTALGFSGIVASSGGGGGSEGGTAASGGTGAGSGTNVTSKGGNATSFGSGGGGGGYNSAEGGDGGNGFAGLVIIRYPMSS